MRFKVVAWISLFCNKYANSTSEVPTAKAFAMRLEVALVQYSFLIILWNSNLVIVALILKRQPFNFYKKSPTLAMLFVLTFILGVHQILQFTLWMMYFLKLSLNRATVGNVAVIWGVISICFLCIYDLLTIVLFVQRIAIIINPTKCWRALDRFLHLSLAIVGIALFIYLIKKYMDVIDFSAIPTTEECFTLVCSTPFVKARDAINLKSTLSVVNVVVGSVFLALFLKLKKFEATNVRKINQVTRFLFFARLVFEMLPLVVDTIFANQTGRSIGYYIGAYGAIGCSLEESCFISVYYVVFRSENKVFLPVSSK
ncbi:hypothetical protein QR680_010089 [Steinernema hermaphroditum]|uniref:Uncharacterized protein n=1 Tax=Steinernema hermaphroditum TaxID=289476 RepID=A0AA39IQA0_9BILA|nr:hypothetical protein QR680_010089 [Steinernema hermaphroditum]